MKRFQIHRLDMGWVLAIRIRLPFPLRWDTIKYSLRHQGLRKSIKNWWHVPVDLKTKPYKPETVDLDIAEEYLRG